MRADWMLPKVEDHVEDSCESKVARGFAKALCARAVHHAKVLVTREMDARAESVRESSSQRAVAEITDVIDSAIVVCARQAARREAARLLRLQQHQASRLAATIVDEVFSASLSSFVAEKAAEHIDRQRPLSRMELNDIWSHWDVDTFDPEEERCRARLAAKRIVEQEQATQIPSLPSEALQLAMQDVHSPAVSSSCAREPIQSSRTRPPSQQSKRELGLFDSFSFVPPLLASGSLSKGHRSRSGVSRSQKTEKVVFRIDDDEQVRPAREFSLTREYDGLGAQIYSMNDGDEDLPDSKRNNIKKVPGTASALMMDLGMDACSAIPSRSSSVPSLQVTKSHGQLLAPLTTKKAKSNLHTDFASFSYSSKAPLRAPDASKFGKGHAVRGLDFVDADAWLRNAKYGSVV